METQAVRYPLMAAGQISAAYAVVRVLRWSGKLDFESQT